MPTATPSRVFTPIDPRIRRRRIEVQRRAGRRRLRVVVGVLSMVLLTAAGWAAVRSPFLDVDRVEVRGATRTGRGDVLRAGDLHRGMAMLDVDPAGAARRLEELPWVARARVRRSWPSTVLVTLEERQPKAVTSTDGAHWAVLDQDGRVLDAGATRLSGLVAIEGVDPAGPPGSTLASAAPALRLIGALSPPLAARADAAVAMQGGEVALRLLPRGTVRFGLPVDLTAKVRAAESVLAQVDTQDLDVLDVRLPASPVLTRG